MSDCIFCEIANGEISSAIVFEDDKLIAFHDLNPQAPVHILIIPKTHFDNILLMDSSHTDLIGHLCITAANIARQEGIAEDGFRLVVNCNEHGGQSVSHIHVHLLGGRKMQWPPG
jgi:histidine triad (HIT) family protein